MSAAGRCVKWIPMPALLSVGMYWWLQAPSVYTSCGIWLVVRGGRMYLSELLLMVACLVVAPCCACCVQVGGLSTRSGAHLGHSAMMWCSVSSVLWQCGHVGVGTSLILCQRLCVVMAPIIAACSVPCT